MSRKDILFLCFASTLPVSCALPGITPDYETGGGASVGGKQTNAGGSRAQGGSSNLGGTAANAGSSSLGGTNANGGTSNTAGSNAGGDTAIAGGTASTGGNSGATSALGGNSSVGGTPSGGTSAAGDTANVGGASTLGGSTGVGGVTGVGGNTAATGGANPTGGASAATGGTVATTGGSSATTGGTVAVTGGASATTGGTVAVTGGTSATGGAPSTGGASSAPVPTAVTAGWYHSCALMSDGTARCWGTECAGFLGNGVSDPKCTPWSDQDDPSVDLMQTQPVAVSGISDAIAIASGAGSLITCAITASHQVKCWGDDTNGQLGDGLTQTFSSTPVATQGINNAVAISVGKLFSCALLADTTVQCWGSNSGRGLGDGTTNDSAVPVTVVVANNSPLTNVVSVSVGRTHACAVLKDNSVWCWGENYHGELGNGDTTFTNSAVAIPSNFKNVKTVGAGIEFTCVLTLAGAVSCVGYNDVGELGNNMTSSDQSVTVVTPQGLNSNITSLAAGSYYNCAVGTDSSGNAGSVQCWGWNAHAQLGNGNTNDSAKPAPVKNLMGVVTVAPGSWHTCAITSSNAVYCWGAGLEGELGIGKASNSAIPQLVTGF